MGGIVIKIITAVTSSVITTALVVAFGIGSAAFIVININSKEDSAISESQFENEDFRTENNGLQEELRQITDERAMNLYRYLDFPSVPNLGRISGFESSERRIENSQFQTHPDSSVYAYSYAINENEIDDVILNYVRFLEENSFEYMGSSFTEGDVEADFIQQFYQKSNCLYSVILRIYHGFYPDNSSAVVVYIVEND